MTSDHTAQIGGTSAAPQPILSFRALGRPLQLQPSALFGANSISDERGKRLLLLLAWLVLVAWLLAHHIVWRDEVRAFTLALSGSSVGEMLHNVHGEGHPALWYLLLRVVHDLFPVRHVLPVAGAVIGIGAMALFALRAPFPLWVIALVLFSLFGAFEYVVISRNYGISALVMFALAELYPRVKGTPWFGLILLILCNTNVPSCMIAAAFLLFRFVEMLSASARAGARDWLMLILNGALALVGALLCFATVYPPLDADPMSSNFASHRAWGLLSAIVRGDSFSYLVLNLGGWVPALLLWATCLVFIRKPAALFAVVAALVGLKLFFYLVYPSGYRHEALFVVFELSLLWMCAEGAGGSWRERRFTSLAGVIGTVGLVLLLLAQTADLASPLYRQLKGVPYSRSADVARLLKQPSLSGAVVMADPDAMLEPLPYYADNPLWFLREGRFDRMFWQGREDRQVISTDAVLADAELLHRQTGRPVVFLSHARLDDVRPRRIKSMYRDWTVVDPASIGQFEASTRLVARLRPAITDESYDVYVYPR